MSPSTLPKSGSVCTVLFDSQRHVHLWGNARLFGGSVLDGSVVDPRSLPKSGSVSTVVFDSHDNYMVGERTHFLQCF